MGQKRYTAEQIIGTAGGKGVSSCQLGALTELLTQLYLRNLRSRGLYGCAACAIHIQRCAQLARLEASSTFLRIRRLGVRIPPGVLLSRQSPPSDRRPPSQIVRPRAGKP